MAGPEGPRELPGRRARALVSCLALHAGTPVAAEQLVDWVWAGSPPANPINALQVQVSKLRRLLQPVGIAAAANGYRLEIDRDRIDAHRFDRLVADARAAADQQQRDLAEELLREGLALWRGRPLSDVDHPDLLAAAARLEELRLDALELSFELRLGSAGPSELAALGAELDLLLDEHPLRERLWIHRIGALYRSGRQSDALRAYQRARQHLADEVGLEPGPELRALEAAILAQDPALHRPVDALRQTVSSALHGEARSLGGNLPSELNRFIGRVEELAAVKALVGGDDRLVTLVGPGGAGKTRLALAAARAQHPAPAAGIWLVELAPLLTAADVGSTIATSLGALEGNELDPDPLGTDVVVRLANFIGQRPMLLVLDNCEHVIADAAATVDRLLRVCGRLRVLATSREALGVPGERLWPVPPMVSDDAIELFEARVLAGRHEFRPDERERALIAEVCWRLDGLPLAVELAAARLKSLSLEELAARLDDRFRLLTGGARSVLPRQQTLRAVVDWSYDLLDGDEQRVWQNLSVFAGGCRLDAAEAVCADVLRDGADVMAVIDSLIDKSLIVVSHDEGGTRFRLLQTIALYGREKLAASGRADEVRDRHVAFWAALAPELQRGVQSPEQAQWMFRLRAEVENLRAAVSWAVHRGDARSAMAISAGALWFFWLEGDLVTGSELLRHALSIAGDEPSALRARCVVSLAWLDKFRGFGDVSIDDLLAAVELARSTADHDTIAFALLLTANHCLHDGDGERMYQLTLEAEEHLAAVDYRWGLAVSRLLQSMYHGFTGRRDLALSLMQEALDRFRAVGDRWGQGVALSELAEAAEVRGDYDGAIEALEESRRLVAASGGMPFDAFLQARLANVVLLQGRIEEAEKLHDQALTAARQAAMVPETVMALASASLSRIAAGRYGEARALLEEAHRLSFDTTRPHLWAFAEANLGFVEELEGNLDAAEGHHRDALQALFEARDVRGMAMAIEGLAGVAAARAEGRRAAELLGLAHGLRCSVDAPMPAGERALQVDRIERATRDLLGDDAFATSFDAGLDAGLAAEPTSRITALLN